MLEELLHTRRSAGGRSGWGSCSRLGPGAFRRSSSRSKPCPCSREVASSHSLASRRSLHLRLARLCSWGPRWCLPVGWSDRRSRTSKPPSLLRPLCPRARLLLSENARPCVTSDVYRGFSVPKNLLPKRGYGQAVSDLSSYDCKRDGKYQVRGATRSPSWTAKCRPPRAATRESSFCSVRLPGLAPRFACYCPPIDETGRDAGANGRRAIRPRRAIISPG